MCNKQVGINNFLGLTSTSEVEELIYQKKRKTRLSTTDKLQAWHKKYEEAQVKLEESFSYEGIDSISVKFWVDFNDDGYVPEGEVTDTFAIIGNGRIPDTECHKQLSKLLEYIQTNNLLPKTARLRMFLSDSAALHPNLIEKYEYMMTKNWQIQIINIKHEQLDELMDKLKGYSNIVPFNIHSES